MNINAEVKLELAALRRVGLLSDAGLFRAERYLEKHPGIGDLADSAATLADWIVEAVAN